LFGVLEPATLHRVPLGNRFIRSATWDGLADERGGVTDSAVRLYEGLARGGVGLIVTGYAFVSKHGQAVHGQYGIDSDEMIPGMKRLVRAAHEQGAPIAAQIVHCGISSTYLARKGEVALAPAPLEGRQPHRAMTEEEIEGILDDFAAAAVRVREAGFDAVQLHGAHGYLFSQFLSPLTNRRDDRWGGSAENRRRFHAEAVRRVKTAAGREFTVMMKFGVMDEQEGGATLAEGIEALRAMVAAGLDAVEISGGIGNPRGAGLKFDDDTTEITYYRERAAAAKRAVDVPLAVVGGIRAIETAEEIVRAGDADFISLSRPLIREPGLVRRWQNGDQRRATCISCYKCLSSLNRGNPLECQQERRLD